MGCASYRYTLSDTSRTSGTLTEKKALRSYHKFHHDQSLYLEIYRTEMISARHGATSRKQNLQWAHGLPLYRFNVYGIATYQQYRTINGTL